MKKKIAFIGGGVDSVVGKAHYSALNCDGKFNLTHGFFSKKKKIQEITAKEFDVIHINYKNLNDFVKKIKNNIDLVVILSPSPEHYRHIQLCIKAEIPVVCEKPIVTNLTQLKKIKKLLKKKNIFFASVFNYSCYPMLIEMKELIKKNYLGKINHINCSIPQEGFIVSNAAAGEVVKPQKWRLTEGKIPNIYLDLGIHIDYLINFLINLKPLSVKAISKNFSSYKSIFDNIFYWIEYEKNVFANLWISKTAVGSSNDFIIKIFGSKGSLQWEHNKNDQITFADINGNKKIIERRSLLFKADKKKLNRFKAGHPQGFIEAYANFYNDIYDELNFFKKNNRYSKNFFYSFHKAKQGIILGSTIKSSIIKKSNWVKLRTSI
jgi:predicted dehydrogenase